MVTTTKIYDDLSLEDTYQTLTMDTAYLTDFKQKVIVIVQPLKNKAANADPSFVAPDYIWWHPP